MATSKAGGPHITGLQVSDSSTHTQKFGTTVVVNGYKSGPSLRLHINWKLLESVGAD